MYAFYGAPNGPARISAATGRGLESVAFRGHNLGITRDDTRKYRRPRFFQDAPAPRTELLESLKCPGLNGHGCGNRLWGELVPSGYGYIAPGELDLVCVAGHRFRAT